MTKLPIFKVALPTKSAHSTDIKDFALHSRYNSVKIFKKGIATVSVPANSFATVSITHNCGFFPLAKLYVELTPGSGRWYANPFFNIIGEDTYLSGDLYDTAVGNSSAGFKIINKTASTKVVSYSYKILGHSGK